MKHSTIVGGSTAKRVMACPGSVALCAKMPKQPSSKFADEGTLLHNVISQVLDTDMPVASFIGTTYEGIVLTQDLIDEKLAPALASLDEIDPDKLMEYATETHVSFGDVISDAFGSTDFLGRIGNKAYVIDWKFGSGVAVSAEENAQLMFYAAAAMRTPEAQWVFDGVTEIECIIVQPPAVKRWATTPARIKSFEKDLILAVKNTKKPDAPLNSGEHCRFCAARPVCPEMTGAVARALDTKLNNIDAELISVYLKNADILEGWISSLRELAFNLVEQGKPLPGYKLVAKRATRKWVNEEAARAALLVNLQESEITETSMISPAVAEKALKKLGLALPEGTIVAVSSGNTLVNEDDPRPAVLQIGQQLTAALAKLI